VDKTKLVIKKLGYPIWFNIIFPIFTVLVPIILIAIESLKAPATASGIAFKVSFIGLSIGIVTWFFAKKFLIKNWEEKLLVKQAALEHDYSIKVGDADLAKHYWYQNEMKLTLINLVNIILYGGLTFLIMLGISSALIQVKGIVILITTIYVVAYTVKFILLIVRKDSDV
jgi:hypothetical protein